MTSSSRNRIRRTLVLTHRKAHGWSKLEQASSRGFGLAKPTQAAVQKMNLPANDTTRAPVSSPGIVCTLVIVPKLLVLTPVPVSDAAPRDEFGLAALG
jgi:hypothetical protein